LPKIEEDGKRWLRRPKLYKRVVEPHKRKNNCVHKRKSGYKSYRGWTQTEYQNKHYNIIRKDEGT
jgi:hypothetical protein